MQRSSRYHNHRHNQRSQSLNRGQALSQADVSGMWWHRGASGKGELMFRARTRTETNNKLIHPAGSAASCANCAMGNKLSCSCAPLMRKAYRYEDSPWQSSRRRDGHLLRWVMVLTFGTEPLLYVNCWLPKTRAPTTNATTNNWTTIEFALSIACFKPTNCFFFWFFFLSQKKKKTIYQLTTKSKQIYTWNHKKKTQTDAAKPPNHHNNYKCILLQLFLPTSDCNYNYNNYNNKMCSFVCFYQYSPLQPEN